MAKRRRSSTGQQTHGFSDVTQEQRERIAPIKDAFDKLGRLTLFLSEYSTRSFTATELQERTGVPRNQIRALLELDSNVQVENRGGKYVYRYVRAGRSTRESRTVNIVQRPQAGRSAHGPVEVVAAPQPSSGRSSRGTVTIPFHRATPVSPSRGQEADPRAAVTPPPQSEDGAADEEELPSLPERQLRVIDLNAAPPPPGENQ